MVCGSITYEFFLSVHLNCLAFFVLTSYSKLILFSKLLFFFLFSFNLSFNICMFALIVAVDEHTIGYAQQGWKNS